MKNFLLALILSLFSISIYSQTKEEKAYEKGKEAVKLMDNGKTEESLVLLQEASKLDPKCFDYPYEMAYAHCLKKDYDEAIKILKRIEKHKDVSDMLYQMLGNCYDYLGDNNEAIKTYEKGLKKFPESGGLNLEMGNIQMAKRDYEKALYYYENGIEADPSYPSNYYWATKLFCNSEDEVWGMIYGEIFMNLERNSPRTIEISKLLYNTYVNEIKILSDSSRTVSFSKNNVINPHNARIPFGIGAYEPVLMLSISSIKDINMNTLNQVRSNFIDIYYKQDFDKIYPNVLFAYQRKVKQAGHMDAYNHWILMQGDTNGFLEWKTANENKWTNFIEWFTLNPIKLDQRNKFIRE